METNECLSVVKSLKNTVHSYYELPGGHEKDCVVSDPVDLKGIP